MMYGVPRIVLVDVELSWARAAYCANGDSTSPRRWVCPPLNYWSNSDDFHTGDNRTRQSFRRCQAISAAWRLTMKPQAWRVGGVVAAAVSLHRAVASLLGETRGCLWLLWVWTRIRPVIHSWRSMLVGADLAS